MSEWQPIATAPKDGTPILLKGGELNRTATGAEMAGGDVYVGAWKERWVIADTDFYWIFVGSPNYWAPLPPDPPPTSK